MYDLQQVHCSGFITFWTCVYLAYDCLMKIHYVTEYNFIHYHLKTYFNN